MLRTSLAGDTVWSLAAEVVRMVGGLFVFFVIARALGTDGFGEFTAIAAVVSFVVRRRRGRIAAAGRRRLPGRVGAELLDCCDQVPLAPEASWQRGTRLLHRTLSSRSIAP